MIASMMVIGKVLGKKTFVIYLITLVIGAIGCGLIMDNFLPASWFDVSNFGMAAHNHHGGFYYFKVVCSFILFALLANSILFKKNREEAEVMENNGNKIAFKINGMTCNHCKANATKAISNLKSVKEVNVNLSEGVAYVDGNPTDEEIKSAVEAIGFEFKGRI